MSDPFGSFSRTNDRIAIPTIWVAFALSILFHSAGLFGLIPKVPVPFEDAKLGKPSGTLAIRLVPPASPPPSSPRAATPRATTAPAPRPPPSARPPVARKAPAPTPAPAVQQRPEPAPPVIALERPAPSVTPPPASLRVPPGPTTSAPPPAPADDLASYIASRQRAREGSPAPAPPSAPTETEQERHNRVVAENLGLTSTPTFGNDPNRGGGVFQIRSMGYDIAEFAFFGWNKDIKRNSLQVIEVRRGNNENMEIAVARKMISIIRERSKDDFLWQSKRLNKGLWLSARPADTPELEAFILKELFPDPRAR